MDLPALTQQPIEHVNCSPDVEYPLRILRAYRSRCDCYWDVTGLDDATKRVYDMMNDHQDQRARLLDDAIATLEAVG